MFKINENLSFTLWYMPNEWHNSFHLPENMPIQEPRSLRITHQEHNYINLLIHIGENTYSLTVNLQCRQAKVHLLSKDPTHINQTYTPLPSNA